MCVDPLLFCVRRAAAVRCREKKKEWVERLACKSSELASVNNRLQVEVSGLRTEVAHLKMLLLKHRTCPVTLAELQGWRIEASLNMIKLVISR